MIGSLIYNVEESRWLIFFCLFWWEERMVRRRRRSRRMRGNVKAADVLNYDFFFIHFYSIFLQCTEYVRRAS